MSETSLFVNEYLIKNNNIFIQDFQHLYGQGKFIFETLFFQQTLTGI